MCVFPLLSRLFCVAPQLFLMSDLNENRTKNVNFVDLFDILTAGELINDEKFVFFFRTFFRALVKQLKSRTELKKISTR